MPACSRKLGGGFCAARPGIWEPPSAMASLTSRYLRARLATTGRRRFWTAAALRTASTVWLTSSVAIFPVPAVPPAAGGICWPAAPLLTASMIFWIASWISGGTAPPAPSAPMGKGMPPAESPSGIWNGKGIWPGGPSAPFGAAASCSPACGMPRPRMPSKVPGTDSFCAVMSTRPSERLALMLPTLTMSLATTPWTRPLPKAMSTLSGPSEPSATLKVEEWFVPTKQRASAGQKPFSRHRHEGTMTELLPVSATTLNFWPGVPTSMSTVKCDPWLTSSVHVDSARRRRPRKLPSAARGRLQQMSDSIRTIFRWSKGKCQCPVGRVSINCLLQRA
mmetsp:Transcript_66606/g.189081  ORF Transcript_66606/g.189081 Transcript_66606/m.189081 type:complete len:335 (+) Transcript_66606:1123-2127(+)